MFDGDLLCHVPVLSHIEVSRCELFRFHRFEATLPCLPGLWATRVSGCSYGECGMGRLPLSIRAGHHEVDSPGSRHHAVLPPSLGREHGCTTRVRHGPCPFPGTHTCE